MRNFVKSKFSLKELRLVYFNLCQSNHLKQCLDKSHANLSLLYFSRQKRPICGVIIRENMCNTIFDIFEFDRCSNLSKPEEGEKE
jgi:hypothetical protein